MGEKRLQLSKEIDKFIDALYEEGLTAKIINRRNNARRSTGAIGRNKGRARPAQTSGGEEKRLLVNKKKKRGMQCCY